MTKSQEVCADIMKTFITYHLEGFCEILSWCLQRTGISKVSRWEQDKYASKTEATLQDDGAKDSGYMNMKLFIDHCFIIYNK